MTIVCGTDLSDNANQAVNAAFALARLRHDRELVITHVLAEDAGDLARRQSLQPKFLEKLDAFFGPAASRFHRINRLLVRIPRRAAAGGATASYATHRRSEGSATRNIVSQR